MNLAIYGGCILIAVGCAILGASSSRRWAGFLVGAQCLIAGSVIWCYALCYIDPAMYKSGWWTALGAFYATFSLVFSVPTYLVSFAVSGRR